MPGSPRPGLPATCPWALIPLLILALMLPVDARGQEDDAVKRHLTAARSAESRQDYLSAAKEYEAILAIRPRWALIHQSLGVTLHLAGKHSQAIEALGNATELDDQLWGAYLFLGMDYYHVHRFDNAVAALRRSLAINPGVAETHRWLGLSLAATSRHVEAVEHLQRAAEAKADDPEALFSLARAYDGAANFLFERIGLLAPQSPFVYLLQAERFMADRSPRRARAEYRRALAQRPDLAGVLGDLPELGQAVTESPPRGPFADIRSEFAAGRSELPARLSRERLRAEPDSSEAMYWLGRCYKRLAAATLDRLAMVAPDSHRVDQLEAEARMDATEFPAAVEAYGRALAKRPSLPGLRFALGRAHEGLGDFGEARRWYEDELGLNPHHALARLYLGRLLLDRGQAADAVPHLRAATEASPGSADSRLALGRAYMETADHEAAIRELESVAGSDPANDRARFLLASAYRAMGRVDDARREFRRYQELSLRRLEKVRTDVRSVSDELERGVP